MVPRGPASRIGSAHVQNRPTHPTPPPNVRFSHQTQLELAPLVLGIARHLITWYSAPSCELALRICPSATKKSVDPRISIGHHSHEMQHQATHLFKRHKKSANPRLSVDRRLTVAQSTISTTCTSFTYIFDSESEA